MLVLPPQVSQSGAAAAHDQAALSRAAHAQKKHQASMTPIQSLNHISGRMDDDDAATPRLEIEMQPPSQSEAANSAMLDAPSL